MHNVISGEMVGDDQDGIFFEWMEQKFSSIHGQGGQKMMLAEGLVMTRTIGTILACDCIRDCIQRTHI